MEFDKPQFDAIEKLRSGSILCGGVGSGKSRTSLVYYFCKVCGGELSLNGHGEYVEMSNPRPLYIITTAKKRDSLEWDAELVSLLLYDKVVIDSWNNIGKYKEVKDAFFIFDEQRVIGSGAWVKNFYKIVKPKQNNKWILLSATPGDIWMDYIPVFIANGFYNSRREFISRHVVYNNFTKFPKIERYLETRRLQTLLNQILVVLPCDKHTVQHHIDIKCSYNNNQMDLVVKKRWNPLNNEPIRNVSDFGYTMRRIANSDPSRIDAILHILEKHPRLIIFYNFDYELEQLRAMLLPVDVIKAEWNGHKHECIPGSKRWVYLVQYTAGSEGWECTSTDTVVFFSMNYAYRATEQAAGRIDRRNTPFTHLYIYSLISDSYIDQRIREVHNKKENFNHSTLRNDYLAAKT